MPAPAHDTDRESLRGTPSPMIIPFGAVSIFAVLGALFVLAGAWRCLRAAAWVPQGRTWLTIGAIFSAVAFYLSWGPSQA